MISHSDKHFKSNSIFFRIEKRFEQFVTNVIQRP